MHHVRCERKKPREHTRKAKVPSKPRRDVKENAVQQIRSGRSRHPGRRPAPLCCSDNVARIHPADEHANCTAHLKVLVMQFFDSDGVRIAFLDVVPASGMGDPVLLIHGFGSNHAVNWLNTMWVKTLAHAGYRAIALDNRGHGQSEKLYAPAAYMPAVMAEDARRLLDHLQIHRADVMGYSMGARIAAYLALNHPERVRSLLLGGLGIHLVEGEGLPPGIADAMEAPSLDVLTDPTERMFRALPSRPRATARRSLPACAARARTCRGRRSRKSLRRH